MKYRKLTLEELSLLSNFIESLKAEDVEMFWNCLSEKCKKVIQLRGGPFNKLSALLEIKNNFGEDLEHIGIGNIIEFSEDDSDKAYGFLQPNVKTQLYYLQDTQVYGMKIPLDLENNEYKINVFV